MEPPRLKFMFFNSIGLVVSKQIGCLSRLLQFQDRQNLGETAETSFAYPYCNPVTDVHLTLQRS